MKQELKITILLSVLLFCVVNAYSQSYRLKSFKLKGDISKAFNSDNIKQELHKQLNIPTDYEFRAKDPKNAKKFKDVKDVLGFTHERLVQFYKGIKVENSDIRVHYKNDMMVSVNGEYANETEIDIIPFLKKDIAIKNALEFVNAKKYIWEIPGENVWLQNNTNDTTAKFNPNPELVICKNHLNLKDSIFHLAYKIDIYAIDPLSRSYIYVDAKDRTILMTNALIQSNDGQAQTTYSDVQTISTFYRSESEDNILKDNVRRIITKNANGFSFTDQATEFIDKDNVWSEYNTNNVATDAHWGTMMTYDYFKNIHLRNGYDDNGATITNYVHYGTSEGAAIDNAYWTGSPYNSIYFGDGYLKFFPLTCLDIVAHEYSHAICDKTANLIYKGQSGAINEGLSDIWAACVENYVNIGKSIWEMGEEIVRGDQPCMRSLMDPKSQLQPDTYGGTYWVNTDGCVPSKLNDYCGVHTNSGVMNHWFYLLVNGGESLNDLNNSYKTLPIGIDKAAKIVYLAENHYWTQGSTYDDARTYTIEAAIQLFGDNSQEVISVTNSWYAVGVGQSFSCIDITYLSYEDDYVIDTFIPACNIELQGIVVRNGAKLTLDVVNDALIEGPFDVRLGSGFEIK